MSRLRLVQTRTRSTPSHQFTNCVNIAFDVPVGLPAVPLQRAA